MYAYTQGPRQSVWIIKVQIMRFHCSYCTTSQLAYEVHSLRNLEEFSTSLRTNARRIQNASSNLSSVRGILTILNCTWQQEKRWAGHSCTHSPICSGWLICAWEVCVYPRERKFSPPFLHIKSDSGPRLLVTRDGCKWMWWITGRSYPSPRQDRRVC